MKKAWYLDLMERCSATKKGQLESLVGRCLHLETIMLDKSDAQYWMPKIESQIKDR